jgi:pimeloyl-ACP methyl ester carboxylesterase
MPDMARPDPILVLGHGASGSAATMAPHVAGLRSRGIDARAVDLPKGRAERAIPVFASVLAAEAGVAVGGHSFGGRVASLAAADACDAGRPPLALVLLSYPLHPPGRSADWDARTAHWLRITCPVILLSGASDPFAPPAALERALAERLPAAVEVSYPKLGHGLTPVLEDVLDRVAAFLRDAAGLPPAGGA